MEQLFLEQKATIERAAACLCRRYGFSREEIEDFTQHVLAKIWADDCAVLRKYQGRSSLTTYLATVVQRALQDYVNSLWGKWRPSAEARRLGQLAVDLETLLMRDRMGFGEACQTLRSRGVTATDAELSAIAARLPQRSPRRMDGTYEIERGGAWAAGGARRLAAGSAPRAEPAAAGSADELLRGKEIERRRQAAMQALKAALGELPVQDRLIVKMFGEVSIAEIARMFELDQKALYKRKDKILRRLREALESAGVSAEDVADILGHVDT
ncbi:MAG TPA: sigma-70 family RNA polymerase sigma factor [Thermoanaerobaculia bacterium]|nr:sigma-70 family RNA polymerase sigma factor [Thermoanaerobaculia bacterium]